MKNLFHISRKFALSYSKTTKTFEECKKIFNQGRFEESIKILKELLKENPKDFNANSCLAISYTETGKHKKAIEHYEIAIAESHENNEKLEDIYFHRSRSFLELNKGNKAIEDLQKTLEINPENHIALLNLGTAYSFMGKYKEGLEQVEKLLQRVNDLPDPKHNPFVIGVFLNKGVLLGLLGNYKDSLFNLNECFKLLKKRKFKFKDFGLKKKDYYGDLIMRKTSILEKLNDPILIDKFKKELDEIEKSELKKKEKKVGKRGDFWKNQTKKKLKK